MNKEARLRDHLVPSREMVRHVGIPLAALGAGAAVGYHKLKKYEKQERGYFHQDTKKKLSKAEEDVFNRHAFMGANAGGLAGELTGSLAALALSRGDTARMKPVPRMISLGVGTYFGAKRGIDAGLKAVEADRHKAVQGEAGRARRTQAKLTMNKSAQTNPEDASPRKRLSTSNRLMLPAVGYGGMHVGKRIGGLVGHLHDVATVTKQMKPGFERTLATELVRGKALTGHGRQVGHIVGGSAGVVGGTLLFRHLMAQRPAEKTAAHDHDDHRLTGRHHFNAAMLGMGLSERLGFGTLRNDFGHAPLTPGLINKGEKGLRALKGKRWPWLVGGAVAGIAGLHGARAYHHSREQARDRGRLAGQAPMNKQAYAAILARGAGMMAKARPMLSAARAGVRPALSAARASAGAIGPRLSAHMAGGTNLSKMKRVGGLALRAAKSDIGGGALQGGVMSAIKAPEGERMKAFGRGAAIGGVSGGIAGKIQGKVTKRFTPGEGAGRASRVGNFVARHGINHVVGQQVEKGVEGVANAAGWRGPKPVAPPAPPQPPDADGTLPGVPRAGTQMRRPRMV